MILNLEDSSFTSCPLLGSVIRNLGLRSGHVRDGHRYVVIAGAQWLPLRPSGSTFPPPPQPQGQCFGVQVLKIPLRSDLCLPSQGERERENTSFSSLSFQDSWTVAQAYWQMTPLIYAGDEKAPSMPMSFSA